MKKPASILFVLLFLFGCRGSDAFPEQSLWTGAVDLPDGVSVPLRMSLDFTARPPSGYFLVGDEKTPIPEISRTGDEVKFGFSEYGADVQAVWNGRELAGDYRRIRPDGTKSFKFIATAETGESAQQSQPGTLNPGNYDVAFQGQDASEDATVAKFWTQNGALYGTFIAPDGDYGLLEGRQEGDRVQLSRFTGWQAIAIVIEPQAGTLQGKYYAASSSQPRLFVLWPRADLNVAIPASKQTSMKNGSAEFVFSGVSLTGETVRHTDERFKGKALIVDVMGTWCHNCLDEAPVLQKLQERYGKDGLEIVGVSFELSDDPVLGRKNLELFRDRFGITYTLLFCGSLDDENVEKQLHSQLDNFFAYPTAIFIGKDRKVQAIHSGFKGPGTGEEFQAQVREFEELAARLVRE
jgi:thiol-disulfide isomerase/thioredoxin